MIPGVGEVDPRPFAIAAAALALVALSWPVPVLLARWRRPSASPGGALIVWTVLSVAWIACLGAVVWLAFPVAARPAATAAALVAVPAVAAVSYAVDAERGRKHAARLKLLGVWDPGRRVVAVPIAAGVAHTLPTWGRGVVVLSPTGLAGLSGPERAALVAHEMAHALGRHHVARAWFTAWRRVAPVPGAVIAEREAALLLEVVADRAACRAAGAAATASALFSWSWSRGTQGSGPGAHHGSWPGAAIREPWRPGPQTLARLRCLAAVR